MKNPINFHKNVYGNWFLATLWEEIFVGWKFAEFYEIKLLFDPHKCWFHKMRTSEKKYDILETWKIALYDN